MQMKTEERVIGSTKYRVRVLPSSKARALLVRLFKTAGPAFAALFEGVKGASSLADVDATNIGKAVTQFALGLHEADLEFAIEQFMTAGHLEYQDGQKWPNMTLDLADLHFAGRTDELLKLVGFALEVNYGSFFGAFGGVGGALERMRAKDSSSSSLTPQ